MEPDFTPVYFVSGHGPGLQPRPGRPPQGQLHPLDGRSIQTAGKGSPGQATRTRPPAGPEEASGQATCKIKK